jgi:ribosomal protein L37AE/L43A
MSKYKGMKIGRKEITMYRCPFCTVYAKFTPASTTQQIVSCDSCGQVIGLEQLMKTREAIFLEGAK